MFSMTMGSGVTFPICILLLVFCALFSGQANLVDHGGFAARKEASEDRESSENPGLELMDQGSEFFDGRRRRRNPVFNAVNFSCSRQ